MGKLKGSFFSPSKKNWGFPNWKNSCPDFSFKVVNQIPNFVPESLAVKCSSGYLASSGTTGIYEGVETHFFVGLFVGLREDKGKIDEQQYVSVYNQKNGELVFKGYLQHPEYEGRTTDFTEEQIRIIDGSLVANIKTNRLPNINEGPLSHLVEQKIITGIEITAAKAMEELYKKNLPK